MTRDDKVWKQSETPAVRSLKVKRTSTSGISVNACEIGKEDGDGASRPHSLKKKTNEQLGESLWFVRWFVAGGFPSPVGEAALWQKEETMDNGVKVDLQFGFNRDQAEEALAILVSGYYMFESFQKAKHRFRNNYPEVFTSAEEMMIADGLTQTEAESKTIEALQQYFDLLGKMIYMLGYELAQEMGAPFPEEEGLLARRQVSDLDEEEVMNELNRIMNINN